MCDFTLQQQLIVLVVSGIETNFLDVVNFA